MDDQNGIACLRWLSRPSNVKHFQDSARDLNAWQQARSEESKEARKLPRGSKARAVAEYNAAVTLENADVQRRECLRLIEYFQAATTFVREHAHDLRRLLVPDENRYCAALAADPKEIAAGYEEILWTVQSRRITGKRAPPRRRLVSPRPLTDIQALTCQRVGECDGDITKAAKQLGKHRKTVEQSFKEGMRKLGQEAGHQVRAATQRLTRGRRGEVLVDHEGRFAASSRRGKSVDSED
jgi:hypothetical protein